MPKVDSQARGRGQSHLELTSSLRPNFKVESQGSEVQAKLTWSCARGRHSCLSEHSAVLPPVALIVCRPSIYAHQTSLYETLLYARVLRDVFMFSTQHISH
eukprot:1225025-Rhodomonas_salina.1